MSMSSSSPAPAVPSIDLPEEIMELILSNCPFKSVNRFKAVSKSWQSIISDDRFSRIHRINRSKAWENENKSILMAPTLLGPHAHVVRLEGVRTLRTESVLPYPSSLFDIPLCSCNGQILLAQEANDHRFMLWNPSIRKHVMITGPLDAPRPRLHHIYLDPTTDDHKIVFVYHERWAVYSCNKRSWSEMKALPCDLSLIYCHGASLDGCFYRRLSSSDEIVCFDARDGNLHTFPHPNDMGFVEALIEVSGRLYFFGYLKHSTLLEMWAMEKYGSFEKWVKENNRSLELWCGVRSWRNLINMDEEEVAKLSLADNNAYLEVMTTQVADNPNETQLNCHVDGKSRIFTYSENLYLPRSNILAP